jgi:hypothetical protein
VKPVGHAATREPVVPGRRVLAIELLDPLVGSDTWRGGRHLDPSSGVAGGGQPPSGELRGMTRVVSTMTLSHLLSKK